MSMPMIMIDIDPTRGLQAPGAESRILGEWGTRALALLPRAGRSSNFWREVTPAQWGILQAADEALSGLEAATELEAYAVIAAILGESLTARPGASASWSIAGRSFALDAVLAWTVAIDWATARIDAEDVIVQGTIDGVPCTIQAGRSWGADFGQTTAPKLAYPLGRLLGPDAEKAFASLAIHTPPSREDAAIASSEQEAIEKIRARLPALDAAADGQTHVWVGTVKRRLPAYTSPDGRISTPDRMGEVRVAWAPGVAGGARVEVHPSAGSGWDRTPEQWAASARVQALADRARIAELEATLSARLQTLGL